MGTQTRSPHPPPHKYFEADQPSVLIKTRATLVRDTECFKPIFFSLFDYREDSKIKIRVYLKFIKSKNDTKLTLARNFKNPKIQNWRTNDRRFTTDVRPSRPKIETALRTQVDKILKFLENHFRTHKSEADSCAGISTNDEQHLGVGINFFERKNNGSWARCNFKTRDMFAGATTAMKITIAKNIFFRRRSLRWETSIGDLRFPELEHKRFMFYSISNW